MLGLEVINFALNISIITFMWKMSPTFCGIVTGLFLVKYVYIQVLTFLQKKQYLKQYNDTMQRNKQLRQPISNSITLDNVTPLNFKKEDNNDSA